MNLLSNGERRESLLMTVWKMIRDCLELPGKNIQDIGESQQQQQQEQELEDEPRMMRLESWTPFGPQMCLSQSMRCTKWSPNLGQFAYTLRP